MGYLLFSLLILSIVFYGVFHRLGYNHDMSVEREFVYKENLDINPGIRINENHQLILNREGKSEIVLKENIEDYDAFNYMTENRLVVIDHTNHVYIMDRDGGNCRTVYVSDKSITSPYANDELLFLLEERHRIIRIYLPDSTKTVLVERDKEIEWYQPLSNVAVLWSEPSDEYLEFADKHHLPESNVEYAPGIQASNHFIYHSLEKRLIEWDYDQMGDLHYEVNGKNVFEQ